MQNQVTEQRFASTVASPCNDFLRPAKKAKVKADTTTLLPNWLDLPGDLTAKIFHKLGAIEILISAQRVCTLWRNISKDPLMWRNIHVRTPLPLHVVKYDLMKMCCYAIDRSCGQLEEINVESLCNDSLLKYIVDSSSQVRRMRLAYCSAISNQGVIDAVKKLPLLEELDITYINLSKDVLEAIGQCCPLLKVLKLYSMRGMVFTADGHDDDEAFAIAKSMPNLCHLRLSGNSLTDAGLLAILDGCPHLESLDLRGCYNVDLQAGLGIRCAEKIKEFRDPSENYGSFDYYDSCDDFFCVYDGL